jgi:hypothetical protein
MAARITSAMVTPSPSDCLITNGCCLVPQQLPRFGAVALGNGDGDSPSLLIREEPWPRP